MRERSTLKVLVFGINLNTALLWLVAGDRMKALICLGECRESIHLFLEGADLSNKPDDGAVRFLRDVDDIFDKTIIMLQGCGELAKVYYELVTAIDNMADLQ